MICLSRIIPALVALFLALSVRVFCQPLPEENGLLYFPPKLTLQAGATESFNRSGGNGTKTIVIEQYGNPSVEYLLPILFFEGAGSTTIPSRYQTFFNSLETDTYTDSSDVLTIQQDVRAKYHQLLNIVGYRMKKFRESVIELEGGYSTLPGENAEVGMARAEVVRDYLTTIWKIESKRIALRPPRRICDSSANLLRQEEAQRVVITGNWHIVAPVRYNQVRAKETMIFFDVLIDPSMNPADVAAIEFVISRGDKVLSRSEVPGNLDSVIIHTQGIWPAFQLQSLANQQNEEGLVVQIFVGTRQGTTRASNAVRIPIAMQSYSRTAQPDDGFFHSGDSSLISPSTLSLPFFDWRDSTLSPLQAHYLDDYAAAVVHSAEQRTGQNVGLTITGSGELGENMEIDEASVRTARVFQDFQGEVMTTLTSPEHQFPVLFFNNKESLKSEDLIRAWLGEDFVREIEKADASRRENRSNFYESAYQAFDSTMTPIMMGRAESVANYLRQKLTPESVDTIITKAQTYSPYSYELTPEQRYYQRGATVILQLNYQFEEGDSSTYLRIPTEPVRRSAQEESEEE